MSKSNEVNISKKKVAICMRGAISTNKMKFEGTSNKNDYVDFYKCKRSINKFIINPNIHNYEFDFFCHTWNYDLEKELVEIYSPKAIQVEDNTNYKSEILKKANKSEDSLHRFPGEKRERLKGLRFSQVSHALSLKKSIDLKENYERKHKIEYDLVLIYRYDILLWKSMNLDEYNINDENIYVNAHGIDDESKRFNGDFHFVMSNLNSSHFKFLFNHLGDIEPNPHECIKFYIINVINRKLLLDKIIPGEHQDTMWKVDLFLKNKFWKEVNINLELYDSI